MSVRDASELLYPAVMETIASLGLLGQDSGTVKLAQQYARTIDQSAETGAKVYFATLRWLGPLLLDCLKELGATPAARATIAKATKPAEQKPNGLAKLRAAK